ncbi:MAG: GTPase [Burkholderiaceae bacterium]|nr:GTPase [Burkholderiaceae bacterium]
MVNAVASGAALPSLFLVSAADYAQREAAIAAAVAKLPAEVSIGVILEGLPAGAMPLQSTSTVQVQRIAPGCFCCIGNLTMRVTLNRLLRSKPQYLFLGIASAEHLDNVLQVLRSAPYTDLLKIENSDDLIVD